MLMIGFDMKPNTNCEIFNFVYELFFKEFDILFSFLNVDEMRIWGFYLSYSYTTSGEA